MDGNLETLSYIRQSQDSISTVLVLQVMVFVLVSVLMTTVSVLIFNLQSWSCVVRPRQLKTP